MNSEKISGKKKLLVKPHCEVILEELHHLYVCEIRNCVQKMTDISNDNPNVDKLRDDYQKMVLNGTKICEKINR